MQGEMPFYEGELKALEAAVMACGGTKKVGLMLWPDKTLDASGRLVSDCLNANCDRKFDLSQIMLILRTAKDAGCHAPFQWIAGEIGYEAKPVTKAEELDRMTTVIEKASKELAHAIATMERLQKGANADRPVIKVGQV